MRDLDAGRIQRADELRLRAAPRTTGVEVAKRIFEANTTGEDHNLDLLPLFLQAVPSHDFMAIRIQATSKNKV